MAGEVTIEVGPMRGVLRGMLGSKVFTAARALPDKKRWENGVLIFAATTGNLDVLRKALPDARWLQSPLDPVLNGRAAVPTARPAPLAVPRLSAPGSEDVDGGHVFVRPPIGRQREAFNKARLLDCCALFMWMGTGKTFVAINLAAHWWRLGLIDRVLVVTLNSVTRQWLEEQFPLHALPWLRWEGQQHRSGRRPKPWSADRDVLKVLVINVEALSHASGRKVAEAFLGGGRGLFIGDESSKLKTPSALRAKAAVKLGALAVKRLLLSGMPVTKSLQDLWMQFKVLDPAIIGISSYFGFRNRYCVMGGWEFKQVVGYRNVEELLDLIAPYTFVAPKEPGTIVLPPVTREHDLTAEQRRHYREIKDELLTFVDDARTNEDGAQRAIAMAHAADALIKLQQVTNGFIEEKELKRDGEVVRPAFFKLLSTARAELCADVIEEAGEQQVLVYCRFHRDIDMVMAALAEREIPACEYSGRVGEKDRARNKAAFIAGEYRVQVGTAAAGGVGVDGLQVASVTIYYSNTFSLEDREQSKARTDRTGQKLPITYVDLVGSPVDRLALRNLDGKKTISDVVLGVGDGDI